MLDFSCKDDNMCGTRCSFNRRSSKLLKKYICVCKNRTFIGYIYKKEISTFYRKAPKKRHDFVSVKGHQLHVASFGGLGQSGGLTGNDRTKCSPSPGTRTFTHLDAHVDTSEKKSFFFFASMANVQETFKIPY